MFIPSQVVKDRSDMFFVIAPSVGFALPPALLCGLHQLAGAPANAKWVASPALPPQTIRNAALAGRPVRAQMDICLTYRG